MRSCTEKIAMPRTSKAMPRVFCFGLGRRIDTRLPVCLFVGVRLAGQGAGPLGRERQRTVGFGLPDQRSERAERRCKRAAHDRVEAWWRKVGRADARAGWRCPTVKRFAGATGGMGQVCRGWRLTGEAITRVARALRGEASGGDIWQQKMDGWEQVRDGGGAEGGGMVRRGGLL